MESEPAAQAASGEATSSQATYDDLKRLTPLLAAELDHLRASLREHNLWLQRFGQTDAEGASSSGGSHTRNIAAPPGATSAAQPAAAPTTASTAPPAAAPGGPPHPQNDDDLPPPPPISPPPPLHPSDGPPPQLPSPGSADPPAHFFSGADPESSGFPEGSSAAAQAAAAAAASPPPYSASDVPDYSRSESAMVREEVVQRRDQLLDWLKEGEDLLREYSARFAQLAEELHLPAEDVLGTWNEAASDNALPGYTMIEPREELMVGNVGEVPPNYVRD